MEKKIWPEFFEKILTREKTFEVRLANFECNPGDILVLKEWDTKTNKYTGRFLKKKITYVTKTKNIKFWPKKEIEKYGLQIISFR